MQQHLRNAIYNGLVDCLEAAHDTGNVSEVAEVFANAHEALQEGSIDILQFQSIEQTVELYGYDL